MINHITIELSTEDRERLDRIADHLAVLVDKAQIIIRNGYAPTPKAEEPTQDDIAQALTKVLNEAQTKKEEATEPPKNAQEEPKENTPSTNPSIEETPTQATQTKPEKVISRAELGAKVRELMTNGYKEQTKAIVKEYAPTVPGVPEDKVTECYYRLVALEG